MPPDQQPFGLPFTLEQLLPTVGAAIDARLIIEHISAVQEAVEGSNGFWGRCLRQVQRTQPIA